MRVVGEAVFPDFGLQELSDTDLGNGAVVSAALLSDDPGQKPAAYTA